MARWFSDDFHFENENSKSNQTYHLLLIIKSFDMTKSAVLFECLWESNSRSVLGLFAVSLEACLKLLHLY